MKKKNNINRLRYDRNPIKYVGNLGQNLLTSLVNQTKTNLTIEETITEAEGSNFTVLVSLLTSKKTGFSNTLCYDSVGDSYEKLAEISFNGGYSLALFQKSGKKRLTKNDIITVEHSPSDLRIVSAELFKNIDKEAPTDKQATLYSFEPSTYITSSVTPITSTAKQMCFGVIAICGPSTDIFTRPDNWIILSDRGSTLSPAKDIRLIVLFRLAGATGKYQVSGNLETARNWCAITQTFKAPYSDTEIKRDLPEKPNKK